MEKWKYVSLIRESLVQYKCRYFVKTCVESMKIYRLSIFKKISSFKKYIVIMSIRMYTKPCYIELKQS